MNSDDILRMAREADRWATNQTSDTYGTQATEHETPRAAIDAAKGGADGIC